MTKNYYHLRKNNDKNILNIFCFVFWNLQLLHISQILKIIFF